MKILRKIFPLYFPHFQTRLLCAFLLCTIIPLSIIGGISYEVSYRIARDKILSAAVSSSLQLQMQFNDRITQVENAADSLQYDMYKLTKTDTSADTLLALNDTRSDLSLFKNTFDLLYISVFLPEDHLGAEERLYFFPLSALEDFALSESDMANPGTSSIWFWEPGLTVPFLVSGSKEEKSAAGCCRILKNPHTQTTEYAYMLFLDLSEFSGNLREVFPEEDIQGYLVTDTGVLLAGSRDGLTPPSREKLKLLSESKDTVTKASGITRHTSVLKNGWYLITEIPDAYIQQNIHVLIKSIVLTLLFSLPVMLLVVFLLSRNLTGRIRILSKAMETLQLDAKTPEMQKLVPGNKPEKAYDEIDRLGVTFQKMQVSLKENLRSVLELSLTEERLKYQLLQSQINPHFLYNILGSIQTCQSLGKLDTASQMLTSLTRFYRMTLRKSGDLITIRDELEIARLYLEMERLCHSDALSWDIQAEDGIENFLICKFTLQPFLENSILHGISPKTPAIHLTIHIAYGDDTVKIRITDNGAGIGEKKLLELKNTLKEKIVNYEKHFGIGNVNKRISSPHFGNGQISIESRLYEGTSIFIEFDQMEEEDEESTDC